MHHCRNDVHQLEEDPDGTEPPKGDCMPPARPGVSNPDPCWPIGEQGGTSRRANAQIVPLALRPCRTMPTAAWQRPQRPVPGRMWAVLLPAARPKPRGGPSGPKTLHLREPATQQQLHLLQALQLANPVRLPARHQSSRRRPPSVPCHHLPSEELRPVSFEGSGRPAEYKHRSPSSPSPVVPEEVECPRCSSGAWPRPLLSGGMGSTAASSTRAAAPARCLQTSGQTARDRSWAGEPCCFTERDSRFLSVPYHPLTVL